MNTYTAKCKDCKWSLKTVDIWMPRKFRIDCNLHERETQHRVVIWDGAIRLARGVWVEHGKLDRS
jgi:hypothetical protein